MFLVQLVMITIICREASIKVSFMLGKKNVLVLLAGSAVSL